MPAQIGAEDDGAGLVFSDARDADANGLNVFRRAAGLLHGGQRAAGHVPHHFLIAAPGQGGGLRLGQDFALFIRDPGGDLGAAQVYADVALAHASSSSRCSIMLLSLLSSSWAAE